MVNRNRQLTEDQWFNNRKLQADISNGLLKKDTLNYRIETNEDYDPLGDSNSLSFFEFKLVVYPEAYVIWLSKVARGSDDERNGVEYYYCSTNELYSDLQRIEDDFPDLKLINETD